MIPKMRCEKCGKELLGGEKFCPVCGEKVVEKNNIEGKTVICKKCGTSYEGNFCPACGTRNEQKERAVDAVHNQNENVQPQQFRLTTFIGIKSHFRKVYDILLSSGKMQIDGKTEIELADIQKITVSTHYSNFFIILACIYSIIIAVGGSEIPRALDSIPIILFIYGFFIIFGHNKKVEFFCKDGRKEKVYSWSTKKAETFVNSIKCNTTFSGSVEKKREQMIVKIVAVVLAIFAIGMCILNDRKFIDCVKYAECSQRGGKTYGEAFEEYFDSPEWSYFKTDDDRDIVEFTGIRRGNSYDYEVCIQYEVGEEKFYLVYYEVNGMSMGEDEYLALLDEIFR